MNQKIIRDIKRCLTDDLRRKPYKGNKNPMAGHCYVACEVLVQLLGKDQWKPCFIRHEGSPHWFLKNRSSNKVLDITASQFKTPVPYHLGIGKGFLTKKPSKRARYVLNSLRNQLGEFPLTVLL